MSAEEYSGVSEIPDRLTPIVAWRYWVADTSRHILLSPYIGTPWLPTEAFKGECRTQTGALRSSDHAIPDLACGCGIHGLSTFAAALAWAFAPRIPEGVIVVGEVLLWGRILEGPRGWRASRAYPQRLFVKRQFLSSLLPLARAYHVPVHSNEQVGEGDLLPVEFAVSAPPVY